MSVSPYGGRYPAVSAAVKLKWPTCRLCGQNATEQTHHCWYPDGDKVTEDDLLALCGACHDIATEMRRYVTTGKRSADAFKQRWELFVRVLYMTEEAVDDLVELLRPEPCRNAAKMPAAHKRVAHESRESARPTGRSLTRDSRQP